jgi:hypothetical protein
MAQGGGKRGTVLLTVPVMTVSMTLKLRFGHVSEYSRSMSTIWPHPASTLWDKGQELRIGRLSGGAGSASPLVIGPVGTNVQS